MSRKALASQVISDIVRISKLLGYAPTREEYLTLGGAFSEDTISLAFGSWTTGLRAAGLTPSSREKPITEEKREPRILLFDLETAPIRAFTFGLFDQNIGLNQIDQDWFLLSWSAKWLDEPNIYYMDQSKEPDLTNDKKILEGLWQMLSRSDVVITQNGKSFDEKVANARFVIQGIPPTPPYKHVDTKILAKRRFRFTSNKLEYLAKALGVPCLKSHHKQFPGFDLWAECMKRNPEAWAEMKKYNMSDVMALEGVYLKLRPWGIGIDLNPYYSDTVYRCQCGSKDLERNEFLIAGGGKFARFRCRSCNAWHSAKGADNNYMSGAKKASLKTPK